MCVFLVTTGIPGMTWRSRSCRDEPPPGRLPTASRNEPLSLVPSRPSSRRVLPLRRWVRQPNEIVRKRRHISHGRSSTAYRNDGSLRRRPSRRLRSRADRPRGAERPVDLIPLEARRRRIRRSARPNQRWVADFSQRRRCTPASQPRTDRGPLRRVVRRVLLNKADCPLTLLRGIRAWSSHGLHLSLTDPLIKSGRFIRCV